MVPSALIKTHFWPSQFDTTLCDNIMFAEPEDGISVLVTFFTFTAYTI